MAGPRINSSGVFTPLLQGRNTPCALKYGAVSLTDGTVTLTTDQQSQLIVDFTGTPTAAVTVFAPALAGATYVIKNQCGQNVVFTTSGGTGVTVATAKVAMVFSEGTNYFRISPDT